MLGGGGGLGSYVLKGPHGKTPVCARIVPNETHLSGVVESSNTVDKLPDCGSEHGADSYLLESKSPHPSYDG